MINYYLPAEKTNNFLEKEREIIYLGCPEDFTMPLKEEEPKHPLRKLLILGIPAFMLAVVVSTTTHQYAHSLATKAAMRSLYSPALTNSFSAAAGPTWTFVLALVSFGFFLHNPKNLFAASMAFVNASTRVIETISVFFQMLLHGKTSIIADESLSLSLIPFKDPTISIVMLCFFSMITLFLTLIIIHDTKTVPRKWLVAMILFLLLGPMENYVMRVLAQPTS